MMTDDTLSDGFKGGIHLLLFGLAAALGLYNVGRWGQTRASLHALNACVYLGLLPFEAKQIHSHWTS